MWNIPSIGKETKYLAPQNIQDMLAVNLEHNFLELNADRIAESWPDTSIIIHCMNHMHSQSNVINVIKPLSCSYVPKNNNIFSSGIYKGYIMYCLVETANWYEPKLILLVVSVRIINISVVNNHHMYCFFCLFFQQVLLRMLMTMGECSYTLAFHVSRICCFMLCMIFNHGIWILEHNHMHVKSL